MSVPALRPRPSRALPSDHAAAARPGPAVVVRPATPEDDLQIAPLVRRAGEVVPRRPLAVAEEHGRVVAVRSLRDGVLVTPYGEARSSTLRALAGLRPARRGRRA